MRVLLVFLSAIPVPCCVVGQDSTRWSAFPPIERSIDLLAGGNLGHYTFLWVAVARRSDPIIGHHPSTKVYHLGVEGLIGPEVVLAPKAGAWIGGGAAGMCLGISVLYYTNGTHGDPCLRPEIGIGFGPFKMAYGYNVKSDELQRVNTHMFSVALLFSIKRLDGAK